MLHKHVAILGSQHHQTPADPNIEVTDLHGGVPDLTLGARIKLNERVGLQHSLI
jgi:hypothetical protein